MIQIQHLEKKFGKLTVLKDVNINIIDTPGELSS